MASARLAVERIGERSVVTEVRSVAPLALRETAGAVYLVGSAGGPIGGDCIRLDVSVGAGATLVVRSAAASLALPGRDGAPSSLTVHACVAAGATLEWRPEPTVAVAGCRHRTRAVVDASAQATVRWRDTLVLGRDGEPGGRIASELHVDVDGRPRLRHALELGAGACGAAGPAVLGDARAIVTELRLHRDDTDESYEVVRHSAGAHGAAYGLAGGGVLATAWAAGAIDATALIELL